MTREVPVGRHLVALVDDEDYGAVVAAGPWSPYRAPHSRNTYARHTVRRAGGGETSIYMHQVVAPHPRVDHANGDGLDNRRCNLRAASHADNMRNARRRKDNTSGFKGVSQDKRTGRWAAGIHVDRRRIYLGSFTDPAAAARAYDAAALDHFGEFARLNFPEENVA